MFSTYKLLNKIKKSSQEWFPLKIRDTRNSLDYIDYISLTTNQKYFLIKDIYNDLKNLTIFI